MLEFALANVSQTGLLPLGHGSYTFLGSSGNLPPGRYWLLGTFESFDGCTPDPAPIVDATGGSVNVTEVGSKTSSNLKATFTLVFGADTITGSVDATYCAALETPPQLRTRAPGRAAGAPAAGGASLNATRRGRGG